MKWFSLLALVALVSLGTAGKADEASHKKAAEETLDAMKMDKTLSESIDQVLDVQMTQNPQLKPFRAVMKKFFSRHLSYESLKPELTMMYMTEFTESELKDMTAFFKTPTGQKMVAKQAKLGSKGMELGMKRVQDNAAELQKMIQEEANKKN